MAAARKLIFEQRKTPNEEEGSIRFSVGGAAELVTVDADGVRSEIIHRWPDRIGRKISPRCDWLRR